MRGFPSRWSRATSTIDRKRNGRVLLFLVKRAGGSALPEVKLRPVDAPREEDPVAAIHRFARRQREQDECNCKRQCDGHWHAPECVGRPVDMCETIHHQVPHVLPRAGVAPTCHFEAFTDSTASLSQCPYSPLPGSCAAGLKLVRSRLGRARFLSRSPPHHLSSADHTS